MESKGMGLAVMLALASENRSLFECHREKDSPDCCVVAFGA